jgi:hypothetical protein
LPSNSDSSPSTLLFSISIMKDSGPPMRYDEITKSSVVETMISTA